MGMKKERKRETHSFCTKASLFPTEKRSIWGKKNRRRNRKQNLALRAKCLSYEGKNPKPEAREKRQGDEEREASACNEGPPKAIPSIKRIVGRQTDALRGRERGRKKRRKRVFCLSLHQICRGEFWIWGYKKK